MRSIYATLTLCLGIVLAVSATAMAGFTQTAGSHDYDDTANWDGGVIDGVFDETLSGDLTATFDGNKNLTTGWAFTFSGTTNALTLQNAATTDFGVGGANRVSVTLGEGITQSIDAALTTQLGRSVSGSDLDFVLAPDVSGDFTLDIQSGVLDIYAPISESSATNVIKNGLGIVSFTGGGVNNTVTYTGTTTINAGTLVFDKNRANAGPIGDITIGDNAPGAVDIARSSQANNIGNTTTMTINSSGRYEYDTPLVDTIGRFVMQGGAEISFVQNGSILFNGAIGDNLTVNPAATGFSGPAQITGTGTLSLSGGNTDVTVAANAELVSGSGVTWANSLAILDKEGAGVWDMQGTIDIVGATGTGLRVNRGTMLINGSVTQADTRLFGANSQTLGGTGTLGGDLLGFDDSFLSPGIAGGNSIGTLTFDDASATVDFDGSDLVAEFDDTGNSDTLIVAGTLDLSDNNDGLILSTLTGTSIYGEYVLVEYGTLANFGDANTTLWQFDQIDDAGFNPAFDYVIDYGTGTNSAITLMIPEPGSAVLAITGLVLLLPRRRILPGA